MAGARDTAPRQAKFVPMDAEPQLRWSNGRALALVGTLGAVVALSVARVATIPTTLPMGSPFGLVPPSWPWWASWFVIGGLAVVLAGVATRGLEVAGAAARVERVPERLVIAVGMAVAFAAALAWRFGPVHDVALVDDDAAFLFAARLFAEGRATMPTPEPTDLWRRGMLVFDGPRVYTQYFLGWPLLLAPFARAGLEAFANPLLHALTVPAVAQLLRSRVGPVLWRLGVLVFAVAPGFALTAATLLSHTACIAALAWAWVAAERRQDAWFGFFLALAFLVRPISTVGIGLGLGLLWAADLRRGPRPAWRLLVFLGAAAPVAVVFFGFHLATTGALLETAYQAAVRTNLASGARFTSHELSYWMNGGDVPSLASMAGAPARSLQALFVLDHDVLGWPTTLLLGLFTRHRRDVVPLLTYLLVHSTAYDVGVDIISFNHYLEAGLPVLLLGLGGAAGLDPRLGRGVAQGVVGLSQILALAVLVPVRAGGIDAIGETISRPTRLAARAAPALVFSARPYVPPPCSFPSGHVRFFHDLPWPDHRDPVLWVNHTTIEADREAARAFPDRKAYFAWWRRDCSFALVPIGSDVLADLPPASVSAPSGAPGTPAPWMFLTEP